MPELRAFFSNCPIVGEERTKYSDSWRFDTIRVHYRGFDFRIVQRREHLGFKPKFKELNVHTTDVYVTDVTEDNLPRVEQLLRELSWLLSFATYSDAAYFGYEFKHGTTLGQEWATIGHLRHFRPTFETADGAAIRQFLEQVWPTFTRLQKRRKLGIVIHYILLADRSEQPTEVRLLLVLVALESLKSTYAKAKRIPFISGRFRKISAPPKPNPRREPNYTFEQLVRLMLRDVKMAKTALRNLVKLRNTIVHNGISRARFETVQNMYDSGQDILREYVLRLLNYRGRFWLYSSPNGLPKNIE